MAPQMERSAGQPLKGVRTSTHSRRLVLSEAEIEHDPADHDGSSVTFREASD